MKILDIFKRKRHSHVFDNDGGRCSICKKTMSDIMGENKESIINEFLNFDFEDKKQKGGKR